MRNAIDIRRFQDDSVVLTQRADVLVADAGLRSESASVYSRSVPCQAMPLPTAHCANHVLVDLASFARAGEQAPWAKPVNTGAHGWLQATTGITTQNKCLEKGSVGMVGGQGLGTSFGGAGLMSQGEMPTGESVRHGECQPEYFG